MTIKEIKQYGDAEWKILVGCNWQSGCNVGESAFFKSELEPNVDDVWEYVTQKIGAEPNIWLCQHHAQVQDLMQIIDDPEALAELLLKLDGKASQTHHHKAQPGDSNYQNAAKYHGKGY